ncbi:MAG: DNA translocase FtsK [Oscillospiraceae bacterium]|nr:DNA translocase FtsK [Oscillospiraceae bacterium]
MRCYSLIVFVLLCGCIFHMSVNNQTFIGGFKVLGDLYTSGLHGYSGGIICGSIAMLIRWACGDLITYILFVLGAIFTLLAGMNITIPSIIRAIRNRPRDDWDADEFEEIRPEPAAVVVNHIANKRIEQKRQRREAQQMTMDDFVLIDESAAPVTAERPAPKRTAKPQSQPAIESKANDILSQIETEIEEPVAVAAKPVAEDAPAEVVPSEPIIVKQAQIEEDIPAQMPVYKPDAPIPAGPKTQTVKTAPVVKEKVTARDTAASAVQVAEEIAQAQAAPKPVYCFPPIDLLRKPPRSSADGTSEMRENSRRLNETLESFKIDAHIINVTRGPSVTRYEVELDKGVRLNKLTTVADDIALSLGAPSVRIAPVPGKISVVGIEVPNRAVTMVSLREVIDSPEFNKSKSKSSFAVGKDIGGSCIVGNIAKMPHMLIAGTTGSGKSVCMNSIIISLLYKAGPEDVKLIMVDPKMVELANYNGIPHLMIPVVTDPKKAAGSLQWAVVEMMRRYKAMSDVGVRDLESYNSIIEAEGEGNKLPQLVIIIDELADLMLVAAKEVEDSICRIAQMGRAAGIHLVIATQRPSADVITGLMKANIPSRIAFSVASAMESRIILDTQGAEKLVGKGDMLFAPIGCGKPLRVQGCFVTDAEVEAVTGYVKNNFNEDYDQQVLEEIERKAQQTGKGKSATASDPEPSADELDGDEMLPAAVDVILETGQASVSMLQRRLKLGYARAARIVDEMEEKGIVGPFQGAKPRTILITKEQWEARKNGGSGQMNFDDLPFDEGVPEEIL